jgi:acyl-CoA thioesterase FadM
MIGYTLRVGALLLKHAALGPRAEPGQPFRIQMRAWPWHCDAYRHLNNAVYLRLAEDARWAWTARTPLLKQAMSNGWVFLVGGADVVYRHPIDVMSPFELVCRVEGADERWLYFSQAFVLPSGKCACRILLRAMIRGRDGLVDPEKVLALTGIPLPPPSPELDHFKALSEAQLSAMQGNS